MNQDVIGVAALLTVVINPKACLQNLLRRDLEVLLGQVALQHLRNTQPRSGESTIINGFLREPPMQAICLDCRGPVPKMFPTESRLQ